MQTLEIGLDHLHGIFTTLRYVVTVVILRYERPHGLVVLFDQAQPLVQSVKGNVSLVLAQFLLQLVVLDLELVHLKLQVLFPVGQILLLEDEAIPLLLRIAPQLIHAGELDHVGLSGGHFLLEPGQLICDLRLQVFNLGAPRSLICASFL